MIVVNRRDCISKDWLRIVAGYYEFAEGYYCCKELDFSKYWQCTALVASRSRFTASLNGPKGAFTQSVLCGVLLPLITMYRYGIL